MLKRIAKSSLKLIENINIRIQSKKSYSPEFEIPGTINLDPNLCLKQRKTYPNFLIEFEQYKENLISEFNSNASYSSFKFGDGDYFFLNQIETGSAKPGKRALSRRLSTVEIEAFRSGSKKCDKYFCEIYPENRALFKKLFEEKTEIFPAEFNYGLIANKWMFEKFGDSIGLIGADQKIDLIRNLMNRSEYKDYLGLSSFSDYIKVPQQFACDDLENVAKDVEKQLQGAKSKIFLVGVGHVKSGLSWRLPTFKNAIYLDVGSGIDALAGIIDAKRPYFGGWVNYQIPNSFDYSQLDLLQLNESKVVTLK